MRDDDDDTRPYYVIPRPEGPKPRLPLPGHSDLYYPQTESKMGKRSAKKKKGNQSPSNTPNSSNASDLGLSTPEKNPRHRGETSGKSNLYPNLTELENYNTESSGSSPGKSDRTLESIADSFDSSKSEKTLDESKLSEAKAIGKTKQSEEERNQSERSSLWKLFGFMIIALILVYYGLSYLLSNKGENKFNLTSSISDLRSHFPSQVEAIWSNFEAGMDDLQSKTVRPAIFLLLSNHDKTTKCLAKRFAEVARSALGGTGEVTLAQEKLSNISEVFKSMQNHLNQAKAVVLFDILSLHPEALKAFHDLCDQYTSLVPEAVYLFTMTAPRGSSNLMNIAEKQLKNEFSKHINEDTLKALIARITAGAVLGIEAEERTPCSEVEEVRYCKLPDYQFVFSLHKQSCDL